MVGSELQRAVDAPRGLGGMAVLQEQRRLGAKRFGALHRRGEQRFLALMQRQDLVQPSRREEQLAGSLQRRTMRRVELERVLVASGGAAQIAQPVPIDPAHGVVQARGVLAVAERRGLARQLLQGRPRGLDLGLGRLALRNAPGRHRGQTTTGLAPGRRISRRR